MALIAQSRHLVEAPQPVDLLADGTTSREYRSWMKYVTLQQNAEFAVRGDSFV